MATEEQLRERGERERQDRREARRRAAENAGHREWAWLPETLREAKLYRKDYIFTGKPCERGHIARIHVHNLRCEECSRRKSQFELDLKYWELRFDQVADMIEATGRLHYLKKASLGYSVVETRRSVPAFDNLRAACAKAAMFTTRDGELRCVVPGATRWVVKKKAAG